MLIIKYFPSFSRRGVDTASFYYPVDVLCIIGIVFVRIYMTKHLLFCLVDSGCPVDIKRLKTIKMKRDEKKVPGFDEIIFENRNREYGAYDLRKHYKSAASFSILGTIALCTLIFTLLSVLTSKKVSGDPEEMIIIVVTPDNSIDPNKIVQPVLPKPLPVPELNKYVAPDIVDDALATGNMMINDVAADSVRDGDVADTCRDVVVVPEIPDTDINEEPFIKVEEDPMFPGGKAALLNYIAENTIYPVEASENNIQGKVIVRFAVWSDGSVKRIEIMRGVHPLLDEEALRVVSTLPTWEPGKQNGKPVPVWFFIPVTFQMINR